MGIFRWRSVIFFDKCLSNSGERQGKLLGSRRERRRLEGAIEPVAQMAVSKEVQAQEGGQIGERPLGLGEMVQPLQQQDGDEGCPNLDAQSVFTGTHEALQLEILFERLEKEFDFPAVLVDGGNGSSAEGEQVSQQHDLPFVQRIPNRYPPQKARAILLRLDAGESDQLVGANTAVFGNGTLLSHFERRILL